MSLIISAAAIDARLRQTLPVDSLEVIDESADHAGHTGNPDGLANGTHFRVRIASPAFTHLRRVAQHRLVYDALQIFIERGLHALAIEVVAPQKP